MNIILVASIFVLSINQSFACECGGQLASVFDDKSKFEGKLSRFQWFTVVSGKSNVTCGSALVDGQHVATSAHCVVGLNATSIKVQLNDKSMINVSSVWVDSRYNTATGAYDFAILTLSSPVDTQFKPICLTSEYPDYDAFRLRISPKNNSYTVESNPIDYPTNECGITPSETSLCALTVSFGNEGFQCNDGVYAALTNRKHYLYGVLSRCGSDFNKALYTDTSKYVETIKELAPNACWKPMNA